MSKGACMLAHTSINHLFSPEEWDPQLSAYENLRQKNLIPDYVAMIYNNSYHSLWNVLPYRETTRFVHKNSLIGVKILEKTVAMMLASTIKKLDVNLHPSISHVVNGGLYCRMKVKSITPEFLAEVENKLNELYGNTRHIDIDYKPIGEVVSTLLRQKDKLTADVLARYPLKKINAFQLNEYTFVCDYILAPTSEYFYDLRVKPYGEGFVVSFEITGNQPRKTYYLGQKKLFEIFSEYSNWTSVVKVDFLANLNRSLKSRKIREIIQISETFHEKKLAEIASAIVDKYPHRRLVLIAGPSSSGKTTFSKRLSIHLKTYGLHSVPLSLDNYFIDRVKTPRHENGEYDFENIQALDLDLLNTHLLELLHGKEIELPEYDFKNGCRSSQTTKMKLKSSDILIVEGIHGLNEMLTSSIPAPMKYKIYVSAITPLNMDPYNRIGSSDNRLIRRILRDFKYRGHSARQSLKMWNSVRLGEEKNIFPFQEEADIMFNSALIYEWVFLKKYVAPLLEAVQHSEPEYAEARRLLTSLCMVDSYDHEEYIPPTSILREFLGKSSFHY